jgi:hypothetical protein
LVASLFTTTLPTVRVPSLRTQLVPVPQTEFIAGAVERRVLIGGAGIVFVCAPGRPLAGLGGPAIGFS